MTECPSGVSFSDLVTILVVLLVGLMALASLYSLVSIIRYWRRKTIDWEIVDRPARARTSSGSGAKTALIVCGTLLAMALLAGFGYMAYLVWSIS